MWREGGFRPGSTLPRRAPAPTLVEYGRMPSQNPAARIVSQFPRVELSLPIQHRAVGVGEQRLPYFQDGIGRGYGLY